MDRDEVQVRKLAGKELCQYSPILTEQAWSVKNLLYGFRGNFSCRIERIVPSAQDSSILPAQVEVLKSQSDHCLFLGVLGN